MYEKSQVNVFLLHCLRDLPFDKHLQKRFIMNIIRSTSYYYPTKSSLLDLSIQTKTE